MTPAADLKIPELFAAKELSETLGVEAPNVSRRQRSSAAVSPFSPSATRERAKAAWAAAKLNPITLHECRHTFASLMIAAGVNAKALSTYMGHANISITLERYGHLMPGNEEEAAALLDALLARASDQSARASLAPVVS